MPLLLFALFALTTAFTYWLRHINLAHMKLHGTKIPHGFEKIVSEETLARTVDYTLESSRLGLWESLFDNLLLVLFLFAGLLQLYDAFTLGITASPLLQGVMFFIILSWAQTILEIPFSIYGTFVVEARHGFNTTTPGLWLSDLLKSQVIGSLITALVLGTVFSLMSWSSGHWWLWVWGFLALFSLFMMFLSPYVIEPLFNKFEPVTEEGLEDEIRTMMEKAGLKVGRVMQMDASKRSKHSNAYFTGIGKVKRIVLYDTLIRQMTHGEIVAVLAHEIGHWKKGHIWKRLLLAELLVLAGSWLAFRMLAWDGLPALLGYGHLSLAARLVILGFVASLVMFPLTPLSSWLSRRDEYEADRFASDLTGDPCSLATALVKLSAENLSNLHPHPLYARFYYSHPPVVERVASLLEMAGKDACAPPGSPWENGAGAN
ncbi:MAG TPA: M48 family metallopeptidase [Geobacteraceae bacterium]|nr:M48 family metallopeptidase [Geobacteraceae bacterium]